MMLIRPIQANDLDDLLRLTERAELGMTSLPADRKLLAARIALSEKSFAQAASRQQANYMFALEDTESGRVVGVSAIEAQVGVEDVWYNYRIGKTIHASKKLGVRSTHDTLYLTNDMTGCTEVCSLLLDVDYRKSDNGRMLSRCRFLFMSEFQSLFNDKVFAEMRGYFDAHGKSPFWESLGRKFFKMEFSKADYLTALGNKSFVAELMPIHPIYVSFLSEQAQQAMGRVHDNTRPALAMLNKEGFNFNGFIDIFDGGPLVEAFVSNLLTVRESAHRKVLINESLTDDCEELPYHLVSNGALASFRVVLAASTQVKNETVSLSPESAKQLNVSMGDTVRVVAIR